MRPKPDSTDPAADRAMVIGSGPCGLMTALTLADRGVPVTLVESGPAAAGQSWSEPGEAEIADPARHAPMTLAARRGFGGTSAWWGGRAVPLDPIDFERRLYLPGGIWPVSAAEIEPYWAPAARFLDCGPARFSPEPEAPNAALSVRLERWCARPNLGEVHRARVLGHPLIRTLTDHTAVRIAIDPLDGTATGAVLRHRTGETVMPAPRAIVVAAGGVETARLLLASRVDHPRLFGGEDGALGRYYMGHVYGSIADIRFAHGDADAAFDYQRGEDGRYYRRRWTLSAAAQRAAHVLNLSAWPEMPPIADASHGSAVLSLGYLGLRAPLIGSRLVSAGIRERKLAGGDGRIWPHLRNLFRRPHAAAGFALAFARDRYFSSVRRPGFYVRNPARRYQLFHHGEHAPNRDSRITLSETQDSLGMPRARIDLRFCAQDGESAAATLALIAAALAHTGTAQVHFHVPAAERAAAVIAQAADGFHQIGTARMSDDPANGVVDAHACVHGSRNLFIAGPAIFPTSGQANPTLAAVALAARLGEHLAALFGALTPRV